MTSHHHKQFVFLGLTSSIHIADLPKLALGNGACVPVNEKFHDCFITVKAVM
jgi:hypothetical protein